MAAELEHRDGAEKESMHEMIQCRIHSPSPENRPYLENYLAL